MSPRPVKQIAANLALGAAAATAQGATYVYVSNADSQDISVLQMDRTNGALTAIETVNVGGTVMPMAVSPDKRVLYVHCARSRFGWPASPSTRPAAS